MKKEIDIAKEFKRFITKRVQVSKLFEKSFEDADYCVDGFSRNPAAVEDFKRQVTVDFASDSVVVAVAGERV